MNEKYEKLIALILMGVVTILTILILFKTTEPELITPTPTYDNIKLELEIENQKLKFLVDSLELVDSLHLIQLKEKQILIKTKQNEISKTIYFIPNADTKFKDSLWAVYFADSIRGSYIK